MILFLHHMELHKHKLFYVVAVFALVNIISYFLAFSLLLNSFNKKADVGSYSVFASKPFVTPVLQDEIVGEDNRAAIIDNYFAKFKCPLAGTGAKMVEMADKYGFEFWWLPAIAWQESTCGKVMIPNSYNAWGYGIYGDTVTKFLNYDQAMEAMSKDLKKNFFDKGLIEPCEFEKRYTPPSKGRWCKSIKYFRDQMIGFKN